MVLVLLIFSILGFWSNSVVKAEDAYKYFTWTVTYGTISPLGVPQQVSNGSHFVAISSTCWMFKMLERILEEVFSYFTVNIGKRMSVRLSKSFKLLKTTRLVIFIFNFNMTSFFWVRNFNFWDFDVYIWRGSSSMVNSLVLNLILWLMII